MLSRKVLETIKAPFEDIFDADGIRKYGMDISFGKKAKAMGFQPYVHLDYPCSHWVTIDLKKIYQALIR